MPLHGNVRSIMSLRYRRDIDGATSAVDSLASIAGAPADGGSSDSDLQLEVALRQARTLLQAKQYPEVGAVPLQATILPTVASILPAQLRPTWLLQYDLCW